MNFNEYIQDHDQQQKIVKGQQNNRLPPHLTDPFLRRYHIYKIIIEAGKVSLAVWATRVLVENA